ncbi:Fatty acid oxidation complex subunit alpha [Streptomyces violarus]
MRRRPGVLHRPWRRARAARAEQDRAEILDRVRTSTDLRAAADADLVIEVAPESYEIKQQIFRELDGIVRPETIMATGTNALSVTRLAADSARPERVLGLHFFDPAPAMRLVEIVSSVLTAPAAVTAVTDLALDLGKEPVAVGDRPGFVADGLLFGYLNQAAAMYEAKYASREDIDAAMRLGCGLPMGPLALLDMIGVDTARTVLEAMYAASRDRLHAPAPILKQLSEAGLTGRKAGRGFYTYETPGSGTVVRDALTPLEGGNPVPRREVRSVGVAGSGTMASGIAEVFAKAGYEVVLAARSEEKAQTAKARIGKSLSRSVDKGRMTAEAAAQTLDRITPAGSYDAFADVDLGRGGRRRGPGGQAAAVRRAGQGLQAGRGAGHHHLDERAHADANDDPLLAEVAASAVVTAHNHVLRRWLRAGRQGDVEAQLDHAFAIVRKTFGTGIGAGRSTEPQPARGHGLGAGRGAGDRRPYRRPAGRGHADDRAGPQGALSPLLRVISL